MRLVCKASASRWDSDSNMFHRNDTFTIKLQRLSLVRMTAAVLLVLCLLVAVTSAAMAHARVEIGPYAVVVGWMEEPAIVGERNAVIVEISEGETPVEGVEATLDLELLYAGRSFRSNLTPTATPGLYTAEIFPTVRGQYQVRLFGAIGDLQVDETIEPEEVFDAARLQFPEPAPEPRALQEEIAALESQLQTARTLAYVGIGIGAAGLIAAVFSLWRRRPS